MERFWTGLAALVALAVLLLVSVSGQAQGIELRDLETECKYDRTAETDISLTNDDRLVFKGLFDVESPDSDLTYSYRSGDNIVLNLKSTENPPAPTFVDDCKGVGVYHFETSQLRPGTYDVTVQVNGERQEKQVITVE
jgi:hypothetical protein